MGELTFGDMSDEFEFDDEDLDYIDGPLSGWVRRKRDGSWFAFDCQPIIYNKLWHWTLVEAPGKTPDLVRFLRDAAAAKSGSWLSVTEDRRASATSICKLVSMDTAVAAPVLAAVRAGIGSSQRPE